MSDYDKKHDAAEKAADKQHAADEKQAAADAKAAKEADPPPYWQRNIGTKNGEKTDDPAITEWATALATTVIRDLKDADGEPLQLTDAQRDTMVQTLSTECGPWLLRPVTLGEPKKHAE